jgi:hypothetical protein
MKIFFILTTLFPLICFAQSLGQGGGNGKIVLSMDHGVQFIYSQQLTLISSTGTKASWDNHKLIQSNDPLSKAQINILGKNDLGEELPNDSKKLISFALKKYPKESFNSIKLNGAEGIRSQQPTQTPSLGLVERYLLLGIDNHLIEIEVTAFKNGDGIELLGSLIASLTIRDRLRGSQFSPEFSKSGNLLLLAIPDPVLFTLTNGKAKYLWPISRVSGWLNAKFSKDESSIYLFGYLQTNGKSWSVIEEVSIEDGSSIRVIQDGVADSKPCDGFVSLSDDQSVIVQSCSGLPDTFRIYQFPEFKLIHEIKDFSFNCSFNFSPGSNNSLLEFCHDYTYQNRQRYPRMSASLIDLSTKLTTTMIQGGWYKSEFATLLKAKHEPRFIEWASNWGLRVWTAFNNQVKKEYSYSFENTPFNRDYKIVVTDENASCVLAADKNHWDIISLTEGNKSLSGDTSSEISALFLSNNHNLAILGSENGTLLFLELLTGKIRLNLDTGLGRIINLKLSENGQMLYVLDDQENFNVFQLSTTLIGEKK